MRLALVALLVACAPVAVPPVSPSTAPVATASPIRPSPIPSATRSPRVLRSPQPLPSASPPSFVLSYERSSDIPVTRGPELLVTSDGQAIAAPNFGTQLTARRLAQAGIDALRSAALETGLFTESRSIGRKLRPDASPELGRGYEAVVITVRVGGRDVRVSTFARDSQDYRYQWDPGREELLALADRLADLRWLPASAWLDPTTRPYAATFHRLYIETLRNVASPGVTVSVDDLWPFTTAPEGFGETVTLDPASTPDLVARCAVLTAEDARLLGVSIVGAGYAPDIRGVGGTFRWPAGSGEILLQLEPLLPHVPPTCTGVSRLVF